MADGVALLTRDELRALLVDAAAEGARIVLAERAEVDRLLDVQRVARKSGVSTRVVREWIARGELACVDLPSANGKRRILRIRASAVAAFIASHERRDEPGDDVIDLAVARATRRRVGA